MNLRKTIPALAAAGIAASVLAASPAYAVNTSFIYFGDPSNTRQPVPCAFGTTGNVQLPNEVIGVKNNCSVRMWLHGNPNGTGAALCISPGALAFVTGTWRQWQVTSNTLPCN